METIQDLRLIFWAAFLGALFAQFLYFGYKEIRRSINSKKWAEFQAEQMEEFEKAEKLLKDQGAEFEKAIKTLSDLNDLENRLISIELLFKVTGNKNEKLHTNINACKLIVERLKQGYEQEN
jgi:hypothetical protein